MHYNVDYNRLKKSGPYLRQILEQNCPMSMSENFAYYPWKNVVIWAS